MSDTEERLSKLEKALMGMESTQTGLLDAMTKLTESLNKPHVSEVSRSQDQTGAHDVDAEDAERESHAGDQRHPDASPDDEGDGGVDDGAREAGGATERAAAAAGGGGVSVRQKNPTCFFAADMQDADQPRATAAPMSVSRVFSASAARGALQGGVLSLPFPDACELAALEASGDPHRNLRTFLKHAKANGKKVVTLLAHRRPDRYAWRPPLRLPAVIGVVEPRAKERPLGVLSAPARRLVDDSHDKEITGFLAPLTKMLHTAVQCYAALLDDAAGEQLLSADELGPLSLAGFAALVAAVRLVDVRYTGWADDYARRALTAERRAAAEAIRMQELAGVENELALQRRQRHEALGDSMWMTTSGVAQAVAATLNAAEEEKKKKKVVGPPAPSATK